MAPPASLAPYNIRVNPTGGARTRTAHPCRVSAPPAGYPERYTEQPALSDIDRHQSEPEPVGGTAQPGEESHHV